MWQEERCWLCDSSWSWALAFLEIMGWGWGCGWTQIGSLNLRANLPEALQANALMRVPSAGQSHADRPGCPLQLNRWQGQGVGATSVKPLLGEQADPARSLCHPTPFSLTQQSRSPEARQLAGEATLRLLV